MARHRAAAPSFHRHAAGRENRSPRLVVPEQARPHDGPLIAGQIRPAIGIAVVPLLQVTAHEKRAPPPDAERLLRKQHGVGSAQTRAIDQEVAARSGAGPLRNEIDDTAERAGAVQRGRHAFDDFHLAEIRRWDLQQAQAADVVAETWEPVRQKPCVAAAHTLDADARRAE